MRDEPTGQTLPNPDDARPIVRRPTDLPVAADCDRAWARTQSLVAQLVLRCRALDHCATWEARVGINSHSGYNISNALLYKHTHRVIE